jgi:predicted  nucleic acid-binding Zn-ribbon protein
LETGRNFALSGAGLLARLLEEDSMDTRLSSLELELQDHQNRLQRLNDSIQSLRMLYATNPNPRLKSEERELRREYDLITEEIQSTLLEIQELEESRYDPW